jgi:hypothetical protein
MVILENCVPGDYALELTANAVADAAGNIGPVATSTSVTATQTAPSIAANTQTGTTPTTLTATAPSAVLGTVSANTQSSLLAAKVVQPVITAPKVEVTTNLTALAPTDLAVINTQQTITAGDQLVTKVQVSTASAIALDALGFLEYNGTWTYLGRQAFTGQWVTSTPMAFADIGNYTLKIVLIDRATVVNIAKVKPAKTAFTKFTRASVNQSSSTIPYTNLAGFLFSKAGCVDA